MLVLAANPEESKQRAMGLMLAEVTAKNLPKDRSMKSECTSSYKITFTFLDSWITRTSPADL